MRSKQAWSLFIIKLWIIYNGKIFLRQIEVILYGLQAFNYPALGITDASHWAEL